MSVLHVTNGDSAGDGLLETGLVDDVLVWCDALHEGPVPDVGDDDLRRLRAAFVGAPEAEFADRDHRLEAARDGEYVLWFEADLYDQLQVLQILDRLRTLEVPAVRITLICIGEHVGFTHFGGLGELQAEQLRALPERAGTRLGAADLDYAAWAWAAFRSDDPRRLAEVVQRPSRGLRYVWEAVDRLAREYPSTRDGLGLTERRLLAAVAAGAPSAGAAFVTAAAREPRPFLGDRWAFTALERL